MSSSLTSGERETKERRKEEGREQRKKQQQSPATSSCRKCMGKSINLEHRLKKTTEESHGGVLRLWTRSVTAAPPRETKTQASELLLAAIRHRRPSFRQSSCRDYQHQGTVATHSVQHGDAALFNELTESLSVLWERLYTKNITEIKVSNKNVLLAPHS